MKLGILIKAYNEEDNISRALESCLAEIEDIDAEIVLADSCSTDRTVEIAKNYPIRIVQFENASERSCGAGAQLAYQHSRSEYVYLLDGDMTLRPGFLRQALAYMENNPDVVGVGGLVNEIFLDNLEFENRRHREKDIYRSGDVVKLDCGGLYRRASIETLGYFTDRNLHSYEELDLGSRLIAMGGKLRRLDVISVDHFHHSIGSYELLWKRLRSKYAHGAGEILRAALFKPHFPLVIRSLRILPIFLLLSLWLVFSIILTAERHWLADVLLMMSPFVLMSWRRKSISAGIFSVASWFIYSAGIIRGLLGSRIDPCLPIASRILWDKSALPKNEDIEVSRA